MYKIFQENRALIFPNISEEQLHFGTNSIKCETYDAKLLYDFLSEWLCDTDGSDTIVQNIAPEDVASALQATFKLVPAAGGLVVQEGDCVTIMRKGIPDLPKGHIETGETPETAAMREVEEETGIGRLSIVRPLPCTWHAYLRNESWELKQTYWYEMRSEDTTHIAPQNEEDISEVKMTDKETLEEFLRLTFRSIREILEKDMRQIILK